MLFTSDDLKEMLTELDEMEKEATTSRTLMRELRTALDQPGLNEVNNLGQLRGLVTQGAGNQYAVIRDNKTTVLALIDKGRQENQSVSQFKDTMFHLFRLTDMQVLFARGAREFFQSPVTTEVSQMSANTVVSEMNDILINKDDEYDDETTG